MATQPAVRDWTYAEFARLPDDGNRYEIIAGELEVTPSPHPSHQDMVGKLAELLRPCVRRHALGRVYPGPIDVLFAEGDCLVPDLVFVRRDRLNTVMDRGVESAPDLVVEIVSPSTAVRDRGVKRDRYAQLGVSEYWIIDGRLHRVEIHRGGAAAPDMVSSGAFLWQPVSGGPELVIDIDDLFSELD